MLRSYKQDLLLEPVVYFICKKLSEDKKQP